MTIWQDNFDDNVFDTNKWLKFWWWTGTDGASGEVYERNQRLEFEVTSQGINHGNLGVVSRDKYDLTKGKVKVYMANLSPPQAAKLMLLISPSLTLGHVLDLSDYYRIELDHYEDYFRVVRKYAGTVDVLYEAFDRPMSNELKIEIEAGFIRFYEGGVLRAYDAYRLPSYECHIYLVKYYHSTLGLATYTDWADDFYCEYCGTTEEKVEAKTELLQWQISEWLRANWVPLSIIGMVLAIVFAIIMGSI
jgi:hypothetical protein